MRKALLIAAALFPLVAFAAPAEIAPAIKSGKPFSTATLNKLIFHAYDAELWTDAPKWSYDAPFALSLTYGMGFTTDELVDKTLEEMQRIHGTGAQWKGDLKQAFPSVKKGDRITALYRPNKQVHFFLNGAPVHAVRAAGFAQPFFDIWLSEKTSEPSLRKKLLGL